MNETTKTTTAVNDSYFDFKVWIGNLHKYNCGELAGEWIDFMALDIDEINEKIEEICYNPETDGQDEYFIADYECNFNHNFGEYESIDDLKEFADLLAEIEDEYDDNAPDIINAYDECIGGDMKNILDYEYYIYPDCNDMTDMAYEYIESTGMLDGVPETLARYFDYESFGRDMGYEGSYSFQDCGCIEVVG